MTSPNASGTLGRQGTQAWSETKSRSPLLSRRGTHSNGSSSAPNSPTRSPKKSGPGNQGSLGPPKPGLVDNTLLIMPDSRKVGAWFQPFSENKMPSPLAIFFNGSFLFLECSPLIAYFYTLFIYIKGLSLWIVILFAFGQSLGFVCLFCFLVMSLIVFLML